MTHNNKRWPCLVCDKKGFPRRIGNKQKKILLISIAEINLSSLTEEEERKYVLDGYLMSDNFEQRVIDTWSMMIAVANANNVSVLVTNALGCGTEASRNLKGVKDCYASNFNHVIERIDNANYQGSLRTIVVCFVDVDSSCPLIFDSWLTKERTNSKIKVFFLPAQGLFHTCDILSEFFDHDNAVALVNPTNLYAVRQGLIGGGFEDFSNQSIERMIAIGTTALTMHSMINPRLWNDSNRKIPISVSYNPEQTVYQSDSTEKGSFELDSRLLVS